MYLNKLFVFFFKKLKDVAFPRTDDLKKDLLKKYSLEYQEHMQGINKMKAEGRKKLEQQQLVEAEKKRVAQIRRQQVETEQFSYFEDQLRKQAVARGHVNNKESFKVSEQIDGSMSSCISTPKTNSSGTVFSGETVKNDAAMYAGQSPPVNRALKPAATLSAVQNEIVEGLRLVVLPRDLSHKFLQLADANTARGIETCGILCGILTHDEFTITHVIVPKQSAGPDYCDMENVEELFNVQDQHDLLTLGWIHTHPTQTAFLSSVDLHTHCSYQLMLPEAIAIVCSPKHNEYVFLFVCLATHFPALYLIVLRDITFSKMGQRLNCLRNGKGHHGVTISVKTGQHWSKNGTDDSHGSCAIFSFDL
ncbi:hypothetical protein FKM82_014318 [Ascaphus truei]